MSDQSGREFYTEYEAPGSVEAYHDYMSLRFGRTDNLTTIFADGAWSNGDATDYVVGLIFAGAIIAAFFILWCIVLMVFMCAGGQNVGFLSGAAFVRTPAPTEAPEHSAHDDEDEHPDHMNANDENLDDEHLLRQSSTDRYNHKYGLHASSTEPIKGGTYVGDRWKSRPTCCRLFFILSAIICITFGLLMVTQGITNLQTSINTVDDNAHDLNQLSESTYVLIKDGMRKIKSRAETLRNILQVDLRDDIFCPNDPDLDGSAAGRDLKQNKNDVERQLGELSDFKDKELADLEDAMKVLFDGTSEITDESGTYDVNDWESLIVLIPYTVFPSLLIVAAIMAFRDVSRPRYNTFINWFVLPVFILMTIVAIGFAAGMTIAAGVNSDFCLPGGREDSSPDETLLDIMNVRGYDDSSYPYRVTRFYIQQCSLQNSDPLQEIRDYLPQLNDNLASIRDMLTDIQDSAKAEELALYCGNSNIIILEPLLESMHSIVEALIEALARLLDLAKCGRILPIYIDAVYSSGCQYSPKAVFWIFSCCLILGFFGMVMITLRAAMKPTYVEITFDGHVPESTTQSYFQHQHQDETLSGDEVEEVEPDPRNLEADDDDDEIVYPKDEVTEADNDDGYDRYQNGETVDLN